MKKLRILLERLSKLVKLHKKSILPNKSAEEHYEEMVYLSHHPIAGIVKRKLDRPFK